MPFKVYSNAELKKTECGAILPNGQRNWLRISWKPIGWCCGEAWHGKRRCLSAAAARNQRRSFGLCGFDRFLNDKQGLIKLLTEFFYERFENVELNNINIVATSLPASEVAIANRFLGWRMKWLQALENGAEIKNKG